MCCLVKLYDDGRTAPYLDHDKIFRNDAVVREAAERSDILLRDVEVGAGTVRKLALAFALLPDLVDLFVHLCAVMEAVLPGASDCPRDTSRMPGANARHLQSGIVHQLLDRSPQTKCCQAGTSF